MGLRIRDLFLIGLLSFCLAGCGSASKRAMKAREKAVAVGVHRINQAISAGRVDVATEVSRELTKVVPEPKGLKPIAPLKDRAGKTIVVLPKDADFAPTSIVLEVGTPEFLSAVSLNPSNANAQKAVESFSFDFKRSVADAQRETLQAAQEPLKKSNSFFSLFGWLSGFGVVGVVVLLVFFPALVPIVLQVVGALVGWINRALSGIADLLRKEK
jgi:hypothetical protein